MISLFRSVQIIGQHLLCDHVCGQGELDTGGEDSNTSVHLLDGRVHPDQFHLYYFSQEPHLRNLQNTSVASEHFLPVVSSHFFRAALQLVGILCAKPNDDPF